MEPAMCSVKISNNFFTVQHGLTADWMTSCVIIRQEE